MRYVGQTIRPIHLRLREHLSRPNRAMKADVLACEDPSSIFTIQALAPRARGHAADDKEAEFVARYHTRSRAHGYNTLPEAALRSAQALFFRDRGLFRRR